MKGSATKKLLCSVLIIALVLGLLPQTGRSTKVQADDTLTTTVRATKILTGEGAPALKDDQFTFTLRDKSSGDEYTATNKADGSVVFENVSVPKRAGTYEFVMEEVKGNDPAITYDGEAKSVTVRVSEEGATSVFVTPQPVADFPANDGTNQHEGYGETWFRIGNPFVDENGNKIAGVQVTVKEGETVVHRWTTTGDDSQKDIRVKAGVEYVISGAHWDYNIGTAAFTVGKTVKETGSADPYIGKNVEKASGSRVTMQLVKYPGQGETVRSH